MEQYIKKSALVAEIERLISIANPQYDLVGNEDIRNRILWSQQASVCNQILAFLDTLEEKEVDLYKELDVYFAQFKGLEKSYWNWRIDSINIHAQGIYDFAKHFFELGLKAKGE